MTAVDVDAVDETLSGVEIALKCFEAVITFQACFLAWFTGERLP
jgi:hypothetical protein